MADLTGQDIGRYHIVEQLGQRAWHGVQGLLHQPGTEEVAVKFIRRDAFPREMSERVLKRFEREAKALAQLAHPNIDRIYNYGEYEGSPYLVMEYAQDENLIHRDVKPANILMSRKRQPMLSDFGIAKILDLAGGSVPDVLQQVGESLDIEKTNPH